MNSLLLLQGIAWGILLGIFFFGSLWMTVRHIPNSRRPNRLLLVSAFGRFSVTLFCFWIMLKQDLVIFAAALLFFLLMRVLCTGAVGRSVQGGAHAN